LPPTFFPPIGSIVYYRVYPLSSKTWLAGWHRVRTLAEHGMPVSKLCTPASPRGFQEHASTVRINVSGTDYQVRIHRSLNTSVSPHSYEVRTRRICILRGDGEVSYPIICCTYRLGSAYRRSRTEPQKENAMQTRRSAWNGIHKTPWANGSICIDLGAPSDWGCARGRRRDVHSLCPPPRIVSALTSFLDEKEILLPSRARGA